MTTITRVVLLTVIGFSLSGCSSGPSTLTTQTDSAAMKANLSATAPTSINYTVKGTIPKIKQPTNMTCWAATATIMQAWKDNSVYKIADVMNKAGSDFANKFQNNKGLSGGEKPFFLQALGMKSEPPQNYSVQGWLALLQKHGPLWVTTNEGTTQNFAVHARVLKGIVGDGTPKATFLTLIDPASGNESSESVEAFTKKLEEIARLDLGGDADIRPQVVHF